MDADVRKMNFTLLGSKEQYDKLFSEIHNIPSTLNPEDILKEIRAKLSLIIFIAQTVEDKNIENFTFYRIRVQNEGEKPINENDIKSFSYPPDSVPILPGRANLANEQVFYASGDSHTPFHELADHIKLGSSIVYLSKWGVKPIPSNIHMRSLFYGIDENREDNYSSLMAKGVNQYYLEMTKDIPQHLQEVFLYYQKRYTELFTYPGDKLYHISSAIAHEAFYNPRNEQYDSPIIMYPSVAKKKESVNFALRKDFVDNYLYLKEVDKFIVTEINDKSNSYKPLKRGIPINNEINWYDLKSTVKINEAFASFDEKGPLNSFEAINPSEALTHCCQKHSFSVHKFLQDNHFTEARILETLNSIPIQAVDFKKQTQIEYVAFVKIEGNLFLSTEMNVPESRPIKFLKVPVTLELCYE